MKNQYFRKKPVIIEAYQTSKELIRVYNIFVDKIKARKIF